MHALATGRSGCTHFALAISTTAPSASLEASHASGHLVLRLDGGLLGGRAARGRALGLEGRGFVGDGEEQAAVRRARAREQPRDASSHESIKPIFGAREGRAGDRGRTCATQTRTGARTAKKAAVADMLGKV